ncbi:LysR family transcriptional regulator [Achromobacter piechaudii]|uniref:HTH-type transcriptional regulator GbpR n=1 Tax=Achromobacter piechaudii TaxID=72556 RepID=A0ABN7EZA7_9BURK|nr:LysR family transcriptional regulator [Achromobacter piechaudii]CAB3700234.1 HTH-type transcriptional regulator GbpR [Achromobacter piechaudii]CAB3852219.1 HTH-type transcriptional regulator GbpR [Achromobacter piechaudii]CAB3950795.1 HTH-type transcriptional regulator GbpR [Achromobacter piechaudii]
MERNLNVPALLSRLRMRQIVLLLAIDERGTLRAAATQLNMTQSAASKMLHELELALGQPLFERVGRGLALTPAGVCVMGYFRGMRGTMSSLARELDELRLGSAGKLFIGSIMAASPGHLTDALLRLKQTYPLLAVEISTGTSDLLITQLNEGRLDVVIGRMQTLSDRNYVFRPIGDEALSVIAALDHPLAAHKRLSFEAMLAYPWILQPHGSPMREVIEQEFHSHNVATPPGLIESASILTTTNLAMKSQMLGVIPESVASRYAAHGLLAILPYQIRQSLTAFGSIVPRDRPLSAAGQHFVDLLHENKR